MSHTIATKVIKTAHLPLRMLVILGMLLGMLGMFAPATPAEAASVTSASFGGGEGTVTVDGKLYAKEGGKLTFTVKTSNSTKCVVVTGEHEDTQILVGTPPGENTWTFKFTAGTGNGVKSVEATAYSGLTSQGKCTGNPGSATASYTLDNTGPTLAYTLSSLSTPNAAGWYTKDVNITWSATDNVGGSGVGSDPTPATDSVTSDGTTTKTSEAYDRLGNKGTGSVTVKLDKTAPTISGSRSPAANGNGWNNTDVTVSFSCKDATSGVATEPVSPQMVSMEGAGQSRSASCTDAAGNNASATVGDATNGYINIDKTAPGITSSVTTADGKAYTLGTWTKQDVTVSFKCDDKLSGVASCLGSTTLSGEGATQSVTGTATDKADNSARATVGDATNGYIKIDKTAPNTTASAPANWNNVDVTVTLDPRDSLSGVKDTYYELDGVQGTGTSITISAEGTHTLKFWSVDNAGNVETAKTITVKIDKTKPTINHTQSPKAENGWNNADVTVTFTCSDGGSGIANCTAVDPAGQTYTDENGDGEVSLTVMTEGKAQPVTGTATDNAGNTATDPATVSIDKTKPTISGAPDRDANTNDWYKDDVKVSFKCADTLSGVASCAAPRTLGEGADQKVTGTATDAAGNSDSTTVGPINIDKTKPELGGAATTTPNGNNGWYTGDVTISWTTCSDSLSGLAAGACPADEVLKGEGENVCASASVSDLAGNATDKTVCVKIDRTAPVTLASVSGTQFGDWYTGTVEVTLKGADKLSGMAKISYSVNGGAAQPYSAGFSFSESGTYTIKFWGEDNAGNVEAENTITRKLDNTKPTIKSSLTSPANAAGWHNTEVTVSFKCDDAHSGIASCTGGMTLTGDGANQQVTGTATDNVGLQESTTVVVNIDKTVPSITASATTADGNPYTSGSWTNQDVTVSFTCSDPKAANGSDGSGIPAGACPTAVTISADTAAIGQDVSGSVSDAAGNAATSNTINVKVDKTAPTVGTPTFSVNPKAVSESTVLTVSASDALSGVAGGEYFIGADPGQGNGTAMAWVGSTLSATIGTWLTPGVYSVSVRSRDLVGNWSSVSTDYLVVYDPDGGFVTGGGWINSPAGAYTADSSLTGRANFGFVSKYQKGANVPTGQTEFQFKVGNLSFKSTAYDWLVVSGAKAQYKGTGTINGAGEYGFMLTSTDGQLDGTGIDKFRIKIWDKATGKVVYDNEMKAADDAAPTTAIAGGQIHIKK